MAEVARGLHMVTIRHLTPAPTQGINVLMSWGPNLYGSLYKAKCFNLSLKDLFSDFTVVSVTL